MSGWFIGADGYPDNGAVIYDFYENCNLPYHARYKLSAHQNDGYPYIFPHSGGWVYAEAYVRKGGSWKNTAPHIRDGAWKACGVRRYDGGRAVYKLPLYEWEGDGK